MRTGRHVGRRGRVLENALRNLIKNFTFICKGLMLANLFIKEGKIRFIDSKQGVKRMFCSF